MKESNGDAVLHKESRFAPFLLIAFVVIFFWAMTGWFFGILVSASGHGDAAGAVLLSWAVAFIIFMAVGLNGD